MQVYKYTLLIHIFIPLKTGKICAYTPLSDSEVPGSGVVPPSAARLLLSAHLCTMLPASDSMDGWA